MKPVRRRWGKAWQRPIEMSDDPANDDRADRAKTEMFKFDELSPAARQAIRDTRFDASPIDLRLPPAAISEDEAVVKKIRKNDEHYSGCFGPPAPRGI